MVHHGLADQLAVHEGPPLDLAGALLDLDADGLQQELVARHQLDEDEAAEVAVDLAYRLAKAAYKL